MAEANVQVVQQEHHCLPLCSKCLMTMVPPKHVCVSGHTYCDDCHVDHRICILCLPNGLDDAASLNYPCRWHHLCGIFRYDEIRAHEIICDFRIYQCPICRMGTFLPQMVYHFRRHRYVKIDTFNGYYGNETCVWYMVAYQEIFVCEATIKLDKMSWSVSLRAGRYSRARDFNVYLDVCGMRCRIPISDSLPCFALELDRSEDFHLSGFQYCVTVLPAEDYGDYRY